MVYLTNVSFAYMEYFGVPEKTFPFLVAINVIFMISMIRYSTHRMTKEHPDNTFRKGLWIQLFANAILLLYVIFAEPNLFVFVPLVVLSVSTMGLVNPNSSAIFIAYFDELSGSASSVNALIFFAIGAFMGTLSGLYFDGSLVPMVVTMFISSLLCRVIGWTIPRQQNKVYKFGQNFLV